VYGLRYRGSLEPTTQAEFEGLVAALQEFLLTEHNEDGTHRSQTSGQAPVPIGGMVQWLTETPPEGWLLCDGRPVARTTYARLFSVIGTTFGTGDGVLTFNLPNMRGRFPFGVATSGTGNTLGDTFGSIDHTHSVGGHTHSISSGGAHTHTVDSHTHDLSDLETAATATAGGVDINYQAGASTLNFSVGGHAHFTTTNTETSDAASPGTDSQGAHDHTGVTGSGGAGDSDAENPPGFALHFIILAGV
jgi:microcystin-dependent protein